jgi:hypothetical protein
VGMGKRRRTDEEGAGQEAPDAEGEEEEEKNPYKNDTALSMLKFRNYVPRDKHLRYFMLARPEVVPDIDMGALCQPLSEKNGERTPHPHNRLGPPTTFPHRRTCFAPGGLPCSVAPSPRPARFLAAARLCERCVCLCRHHITRAGIMDIAPKKANWDLKRDVARKLARLERRTQRAVIELIRDKVEGTMNGHTVGGGDELNKAIENRQREAELADSDED